MSRRALVLLAAMAVMVALFVTAAYAAGIMGTNTSDKLYESQKSDVIKGLRGADNIHAETFGFDTDRVSGGKGTDLLKARDGDDRDTLNGGNGMDKCIGDQLDTYKGCELTP